MHFILRRKGQELLISISLPLLVFPTRPRPISLANIYIGSPDGKAVGRVISILTRAVQPRDIVARVTTDPTNNHWIVDPSNDKPVYIPSGNLLGASRGGKLPLIMGVTKIK